MSDRHGSTTEDFTPSFILGGTGMPSIQKNIDIEDQQILHNSHCWEGNTPYPSVSMFVDWKVDIFGQYFQFRNYQ